MLRSLSKIARDRESLIGSLSFLILVNRFFDKIVCSGWNCTFGYYNHKIGSVQDIGRVLRSLECVKAESENTLSFFF
jgi:hypothetical protein